MDNVINNVGDVSVNIINETQVHVFHQQFHAVYDIESILSFDHGLHRKSFSLDKW